MTFESAMIKSIKFSLGFLAFCALLAWFDMVLASVGALFSGHIAIGLFGLVMLLAIALTVIYFALKKGWIKKVASGTTT